MFGNINNVEQFLLYEIDFMNLKKGIKLSPSDYLFGQHFSKCF